MFTIIKRRELNPTVTELWIHAPLIAKKAKAGQFIIVRAKEDSERIPLTISSAQDGKVTVVYQKVGGTTLALDQLQEGDACYLDYGGREYTYIYQDTAIVEPDDWGPVYCREYGCLTLTSCDPVGTSERRIVVTARRVDSAQKEKEADAAQS